MQYLKCLRNDPSLNEKVKFYTGKIRIRGIYGHVSKIDIFTHIMPIQYKEKLFKIAPPELDILKNVGSTPTMFDLDQRFRIMDKFDGLMQVLTLSAPPIEQIADSKQAESLARLANDGLAELVNKYPDRFAAGVASLPMNNMEAALRELDRAIKDLRLKGTPVGNTGE